MEEIAYFHFGGQWKVIITRNGPGHTWSSRLYTGDTATLVCAKHKTQSGAEAWAIRQLDKVEK